MRSIWMHIWLLVHRYGILNVIMNIIIWCNYFTIFAHIIVEFNLASQHSVTFSELFRWMMLADLRNLLPIKSWRGLLLLMLLILFFLVLLFLLSFININDWLKESWNFRVIFSNLKYIYLAYSEIIIFAS